MKGLPDKDSEHFQFAPCKLNVVLYHYYYNTVILLNYQCYTFVLIARCVSCVSIVIHDIEPVCFFNSVSI